MDQQQSVASGRLTLDNATVQDFTASVRGEVLRPTDDGYDEARTIHNGMIDRRPTLIARCAGVADVMASVRFARDQQLLISLRSGGHSLPGFSEGGRLSARSVQGVTFRLTSPSVASTLFSESAGVPYGSPTKTGVSPLPSLHRQVRVDKEVYPLHKATRQARPVVW